MTKNKSFTITDIYNNYSNDFNSTHSNHLEKDIFKAIVEDFFNFLSREIINEGYIYKMPYHMGEIYIKRFKPKKNSKVKPVDWKLTKEIYGEYNKSVGNKYDKKYIYHRNNHSYGYSARWYWRRKSSKIINKSIYRMKAIRKTSRLLSQAIKHKNTIDKYLE
jgi:hypothetical protein